MGLFRRHGSRVASPDQSLGFGEFLAQEGWQPAEQHPFGREFEDLCSHVALALHNSSDARPHLGVGTREPGNNFRDAWHGHVDSHTVTVSNAWLSGLDPTVSALQAFHGTSVCAVTVPTLLPPTVIQPRVVRRPYFALANEAPSGDEQFDSKFVAYGPPGIEQLLIPDMRRLIEMHEDWIVVGTGSLLGCIGRGAFSTPDEVHQRIDYVLELIRVAPATVMPAEVDHSVDDLLARIAAIENIQEALGFLLSLPDADRDRLAASSTPLALMADVRTPEQAQQRLLALDTAQRAQLFAMFKRKGR